MKPTLFIILVSAMQLLAANSYSQVSTITGVVTGEEGEPLPGVSIMLKGTTVGTVTNLEGVYSIAADDPSTTLVFSYIGYLDQEIVVGNQTSIDVNLELDILGLEEVVVIGYGTIKKSSLTGAISRVENEKLDQMPVERVELALLGQLPGLSIRQSNANAGESPDINIRGISSITGNTNPLIVIDGFPGGDLATLNTGDIESIEVLKDASSAAIYGSRAAGGVILVTTKQGAREKPQFAFNAYYGVKRAAYLYDDILNAEEAYQYSVKQLENEWISDGGDPSIPISDRPADYQPEELRRTLADTDWQDETTRTGEIQNYELSARGGNDILNYYVSGNYMSDKGVYIVGDFKRYSIRTNLTTQFSKRIELGLNIYAANSDQRYNTVRMREGIKYPPSVPVYLPEGETALGGPYAYNRYYFSTGSSNASPVMKSLGEYRYRYRFNTTANTYLKFNILEGLDFKTSLGVRYENLKNPYFRATWGHKNGETSGEWAFDELFNLLNENLLTYGKTLNQHRFDGLLGASFQKQENFGSWMEMADGSIPDNRIQSLNRGVVSDAGTESSEWGLISYFARVNYAFADKYLVSAAIRTDGSSRFGDDKKWGTFPSVSVGWRLDQESFMQAVSPVSTLKLRVSYGYTGREPGGLYDPIARVSTYGYTLGGGDGSLINGATQGTFGNSELGWEKTRELNGGIELGFIENRFMLTADVYQRITTDMLLRNPIPAITGFSSTTTNIGELTNTGLELSLLARIFSGSFNWVTKINYAMNKNEVTDLGGLESLPLGSTDKGMWFETRLGQPIGQFYGWEQQGVWMNQAELDANPSYPGAVPGSIRIKDLNGDGVLDADDRTVLGSYMPDWEFGFINEFKYAGFDLSILIYGVIGFEVYNFEADYYRENRKYFTDNQWFSETDPGDGMTAGNTSGAKRGSTDEYIEDGSFWGIRNINLGYTFKIPKVVNSMRVYVSAQNVLLVTSKDFHAYNPEGYTDDTGDLTTRGVNYGSWPLNQTFSFGVNLNF